ncbi:MAG: hypothetical protein IKW39_03100 [Alphaproteobacteria bacterium]|nr:hypothetical protein [Alphaproteobacteria bacterium]
MFGRFFHGQCSLREAFWKFCVLGLFACSGVSRILMTGLKQSVGYDANFLRVVLNNISILSMNSNAFAWMCFYIASFLGLIVYSLICVIGMWNTYKEYEKSKVLAIICMVLSWGLIYLAIKTSIYQV